MTLCDDIKIKPVGILLWCGIFFSNLNFGSDFLKFNAPTPLLSLSVGTHEISVGFHFDTNLEIPYASFIFQNSTRYYLKSPGSEKKGFESRFEFGFNLGNTSKRDSLNIHFSHWHFRNQIGYAYVYYWDQFGTSQTGGIFRLKIQNFHYQMENDFFAFNAMDRFRTGSFYVGWQIKAHWFYVKNIGYTGDPYAEGVPLIDDTNFPAKWGYADMSKAPVGDKSLSILSAGYRGLLNNQYLSFEAGVDAEQIRNLLQNRWVHDSKWLSNEKRGVTNPHIPMLDNENQPYLYLENQQIRNPKLYMQFYLNDFFMY